MIDVNVDEYGREAEGTERLEAELRKAGEDVFVASHLVVQSESGDLARVGVLTLGVPTLPPRTDVVVFTDGKGPIASARFDGALRVLGSRAVRRPGSLRAGR